MVFDVGEYLSFQLLAAVTAVIGSVAAYVAIAKNRLVKENNTNRAILQANRDKAVAELRQRVELGGPNPNTADILGKSFSQLSAALKERRVTAKEVLRAYQQKTLEVHDKTNCLTDVIQEAEETAEKLDNASEKTGALHGIPVSIKESIPLPGHICTCGIMCIAGVEVTVDPVIVRMLRKEGAVPYVRTGLPQVCMSMESSNPIFGQVTNPHDTSRGPGGSSGGEGALIGGGGSMLGIGSDIGGSIRIPAHFNGICGFKPGTGRVSDITEYHPWGQTVVLPAMGPMARDMDGLVSLMKCILVPEMYELDASMPSLPFQEDVYQSKRPLTIGYFIHDGCSPVVPAMERAVEMSKHVLEKAGHTLVEWQPPSPAGENPTHIFFRAIFGDGGSEFLSFLEGDIADECVSSIVTHLRMPWVSRCLRYVYHKFTGRPKYADFIWALSGAGGVGNWWAFTSAVETFRREYFQSWRHAGLDAIICPAGVNPASKLGSSEQLIRLGSYMYVYNLLDIPAGVVPVSLVNADDIRGLVNYGADEELAEWVKADQEDTVGLPVGVQVATLRWQEETCLRVMKDIETGVNYMR